MFKWLKNISRKFAVRYPVGDPVYLDTWGKQRTPTVWELIQQYKGVAYACCNLNTQAIVKTPLRLYRKASNGQKCYWPTKRLSYEETIRVCNNPYKNIRLADKQNLEEVIDHPLLSLLESPNPYMDYTTLLELTQLFQEITGSGYWYIAKNALGVPTQIWVMLPQCTRTLVDNNGLPAGYEYKSKYNQTMIQYTNEEVIPFLLPNLNNPTLEGTSPLMSVFEALTIENKYASTESAILDNEGRPSAVISAKDGLGASEAARWEQKFNAKFRRAGNGGVLVLDEDASITPLQFSPRDLSRLQIHENAKLAICNAYGVPQTMLDNAHASQYNVDVSIRTRHIEDAIIPRLRRLQNILNRYLTSQFDGEKLLLMFDDASPTNRELELKEDETLVKAGIKTPNEIRVKRGLQARDDGDYLVVPAGSSPATVDPISENVTAGGGDTGQTAQAVAIVQAVASGAMPYDSGLGTLQVLLNLTPEQAAQVLGGKKCCSVKHKATQGKQLRTILKLFYRNQKAEILGSLGTRLPAKFHCQDHWSKQLAKECHPVFAKWFSDKYNAKANELKQKATKDITTGFDVTNPNIVGLIEHLTLTFCQATNNATTNAINDALDDVRKEIEEGLLEGDDLAALTDRIEKIFDGLDSDKAELIAETESMRVMAEAQRQAAKDSGVVKGLKLMLSSEPCQLCEDVEAEGEIGLDDSFYNDPEAPEGYQDRLVPIHPACVCSIEEVLA